MQQPFLADFADLSRRLRPGRGGPAAEDAAHARRRAQVRHAGAAADRGSEPPHAEAVRALDDLGKNPNTLLSLEDLTTTVAVTAPMLQFAAPYQTVCNYTDYFLAGLGGHMSEDVKGGTIERVLVRNDTR